MVAGHSKRRRYVFVTVLLALIIGVPWVFWAPERWPVRAKLQASYGWIYRLSFSPDMQYLAASSSKGSVDVWDLKNRTLIRTLYESYCGQMVFPDDGSVLVTESGGIKVWELSTGKLLQEYERDNESGYIRASDHTGTAQLKIKGERTLLSPTGEVWAVADMGGPIEIRSIATGELLNRFGEDQFGEERSLWGWAFSPDGRKLVASRADFFGGTDTTPLFFWDIATGEEHVGQTRKRVLCDRILYSADGSTLAILELTREDSERAAPYLPVWDANQMVEKAEVSIPAALYTSYGYDLRPYVALSPQGRHLAVGNTYSDRRIHLFDGSSGDEVCVFPKQFEARGPIEFSPDGRFLAAVVEEEEPSGWWTKIPWLGAKLLSRRSYQSFVNVWELPSQRLRTSLYQEDYIQTLRFSPDGSLLATGGSDGEITLWEVPD